MALIHFWWFAPLVFLYIIMVGPMMGVIANLRGTEIIHDPLFREFGRECGRDYGGEDSIVECPACKNRHDILQLSHFWPIVVTSLLLHASVKRVLANIKRMALWLQPPGSREACDAATKGLGSDGEKGIWTDNDGAA